jgi:hypothetical protein
MRAGVSRDSAIGMANLEGPTAWGMLPAGGNASAIAILDFGFWIDVMRLGRLEPGVPGYNLLTERGRIAEGAKERRKARREAELTRRCGLERAQGSGGLSEGPRSPAARFGFGSEG